MAKEEPALDRLVRLRAEVTRERAESSALSQQHRERLERRTASLAPPAESELLLASACDQLAAAVDELRELILEECDRRIARLAR